MVGLFRPVTKLAVQINAPERTPELLRAALRGARSGRRGPVLVEIPRDVLNNQVVHAQASGPSGLLDASGEPAIVEIPIDPNEFPTPATAARRQEAGGARGCGT